MEKEVKGRVICRRREAGKAGNRFIIMEYVKDKIKDVGDFNEPGGYLSRT